MLVMLSLDRPSLELRCENTVKLSAPLEMEQNSSIEVISAIIMRGIWV